MRALYARSLQAEAIKMCAQKGLEFSDRGNHVRVVDDLRKWLLSGVIQLADVVIEQGDVTDAVQLEHRAELQQTPQLGDSGDEDMGPRREAAARKVAGNEEATAAAPPGVAP